MPHVELPQAEFKVVMLGDTFTGKTSLVLRFAEGYYRDSSRGATVGAFFITKRLSVQGMTCKIQIWDTAGQEQFKKLAPMYYKNAAAAIVCYDITSPSSFETLKYWMDELQRNVPAGQIVMAMCATKCDLAMQQHETAHAEELAYATGAMFMKTSAKTNKNVTALFEQVAERVLQFQKQNAELNIPVTLATTAIETTTQPTTVLQSQNHHYHATISSNADHPAHAQPRITPPPPPPPPAKPSSSPPTKQKLPPTFQQPQHSQQHQQQHHQQQHPQQQQTQYRMESSTAPQAADMEEDDVVEYVESNDSTNEYQRRCDSANILMCGDLLKPHDVTKDLMSTSSSGQSSCCIL